MGARPRTSRARQDGAEGREPAGGATGAPGRHRAVRERQRPRNRGRSSPSDEIAARMQGDPFRVAEADVGRPFQGRRGEMINSSRKTWVSVLIAAVIIIGMLAAAAAGGAALFFSLHLRT